MSRSLAAYFGFFAMVFLPASAAEPAPAPRAAGYPVKDSVVEILKKDMAFLASEQLAGRNTGSPEIEKAADYVAEQFKFAGLEPCGKNGTYFQPFTFTYGQAKLGSPVTLTFDAGGSETKLKYASEFNPHGLSTAGKVTGDLVFAGYGITSKKPDYNDYAGLDVSGKVVLVIRRSPKWEEKDSGPFQTGDNEYATDLASKVELAAKNGAAAVILVSDRTLSKDKDDLLTYERARFGPSGKIPVLHIKRAALDKLLEPMGKTLTGIEEAIEKDLKPQSFPLENVKAALEVTVARPIFEAKNVVGTLPGSGPLADETIVIGAHYDHVGRNEHGNSTAGAAAKGKIHYGADDNASGTCGLIELARRFGSLKNRQGRRIVFIAFSGEELGLFGSKHYANNPIFPLDKTAIMLNMDMIGRAKEIKDDDGVQKDRIVVYGHGTGEGLEKLVDFTNTIFKFKMFKVPGGQGPSDHDSFYRKKMPVLFFFTGTHADYHKPTDTADRINYIAMAKVVDMVELFANHFATTLDRPKYLAVRGGSEDPTRESRGGSRPGGSMPRLSFRPGDYEEQDKGVLVDGVTKDGAAEKAGIKEGDFIVEIAGKPVKNMDDFMAVMGTQKAGVEIEIVVKRKNELVKLKATPTAGAPKQ